jgi:hypothetical protein
MNYRWPWFRLGKRRRLRAVGSLRPQYVCDYRVADVAFVLQVSTLTVRRWLREGRFPDAYCDARKIGWRVPPSSLDAFLAGGGTTPDPPA